MASIVQHPLASATTAAIAPNHSSAAQANNLHPPRPVDAVRAELVVAAVRKFGAASVKDIAIEMRLSVELIRRLVRDLIPAGRVVLLTPAAHASRALYGPAELDDQAEFDLYRTRTSNWQRGQHHRDPLVAALFGEVRAGGAA